MLFWIYVAAAITIWFGLIWSWVSPYARENELILRFKRNGKLDGVEVGPKRVWRRFSHYEKWTGESYAVKSIDWLDRQRHQVRVTVNALIKCEDPYPLAFANGRTWKEKLLSEFYDKHFLPQIAGLGLIDIDKISHSEMTDMALVAFNNAHSSDGYSFDYLGVGLSLKDEWVHATSYPITAHLTVTAKVELEHLNNW